MFPSSPLPAPTKALYIHCGSNGDRGASWQIPLMNTLLYKLDTPVCGLKREKPEKLKQKVVCMRKGHTHTCNKVDTEDKAKKCLLFHHFKRAEHVSRPWSEWFSSCIPALDKLWSKFWKWSRSFAPSFSLVYFLGHRCLCSTFKSSLLLGSNTGNSLHPSQTLKYSIRAWKECSLLHNKEEKRRGKQ